VVRDKDLLKYLLAMVLIAFVYLAGHTATALHTLQERPGALMARGRTLQVKQTILHSITKYIFNQFKIIKSNLF